MMRGETILKRLFVHLLELFRKGFLDLDLDLLVVVLIIVEGTSIDVALVLTDCKKRRRRNNLLDDRNFLLLLLLLLEDMMLFYLNSNNRNFGYGENRLLIEPDLFSNICEQREETERPKSSHLEREPSSPLQ